MTEFLPNSKKLMSRGTAKPGETYIVQEQCMAKRLTDTGAFETVPLNVSDFIEVEEVYPEGTLFVKINGKQTSLFFDKADYRLPAALEE